MTTRPKGVHADAEINRLVPRLREAGLRLTVQRLGVFQALKSSRSHPTVDELYQEIRKRFPNISRNTIYVNLEVLGSVGETSEVRIGHEAARFESHNTPHDHVICVRCKKIVDISDPMLRRLKIPRRLAAGFKVMSHRVDFFAVCRRCRVRRRNAAPSHRGT